MSSKSHSRIGLASSSVLPSMLPCDIQAALTKFPPLLRRREDGRGTLHLLMVLAMITEPPATNTCLEEFQKLSETTSGEQLATDLTNLAVHMSPKQCQLEWSSSSGQGAARFLGLLTTLEGFEIASPAPVDHGQQVVQLAAFPMGWSIGQIGIMTLTSTADGRGCLFQEPVGR